MKYFLHIVLLSFMFSAASAQEKHFVFIQSDNRQPFNVSLNGKEVYSSTATGYVIIPKLADGEYNATIGFAANTYPDQSFNYVIDKKDLGFNLKNFGEKGWGLFNLQTFAVTMAGNVNTTDAAKVTVEKPNEEYKPEISFDRKKEPPVTKTETKPEEKPLTTDSATNNKQAESTAVNTHSSAEAEKPVAAQVTAETAKTTEESANNSANAATVNAGSAGRLGVKKVAEVKGSMGVYLTYVDENSKDTVQLIIPTAGKRKASENEAVAGNEVVSNKETKASKRSSKKDDPQFLNMEMNGTKKDSSAAKASAITDNVQPSLNSNCTNAATEQDYARLRRKMAQETTDEKMINEARKAYKNKCFTTSQIKGLSILFLSDEGRYNFFDASYNYVTDTQLYSSLEKEFIDPSFVTRFKAMLHK